VHGEGARRGRDDLRDRPREPLLRRPAHGASRPDRGLGAVEETGGGYFLLKRTDELNSTFTRVAQELRSQYVLGFTPQTRDGKVHKLEVKVKRPAQRRARAELRRAGPT
jgi:hypothetical protein